MKAIAVVIVVVVIIVLLNNLPALVVIVVLTLQRKQIKKVSGGKIKELSIRDDFVTLHGKKTDNK